MLELIVGLALLPAALVVAFWLIVILLGVLSAPFLLVLGILGAIGNAVCGVKKLATPKSAVRPPKAPKSRTSFWVMVLIPVVLYIVMAICSY